MFYTFVADKKPTPVVRRCCGKGRKREHTLGADV